MIDTHCHVHGKHYDADRAEMIQRAWEAGVVKIVMVGVDADDSELALTLAQQYSERAFVIAGLHPHDALKWNDEVRDRLRNIITTNRDRIVAVGEMGLDYYYDYAPKDVQADCFRGQLELAAELNLPISIHCREAYEDCLQILKNFYGSDGSISEQPRGVMHCYLGNLDQAQRCLRLGFMLGVGGASTFKKAEELHQVIEAVPLEALVLETDAPYMTPVPFRGKRNEPGYLTYVRERIAELKGLTLEAVNRATNDNAGRLFRWN